MTVTNVLRHRASVTEETRKRVLSAVEELNYIPVRSAVQNRHVATHAIGVLFLQEMQGAVGYPTFLGLCKRAQQFDHDLTIILRSDPNWSRPGSEVRFLDRRCDGFVFVGDERPELSSLLVRHKVPVVECYSVAPPSGVARVVSDNAQAMRLAVARLVELGHTRIAHVAGPEYSHEARVRHEAFREAIQTQLGTEARFIVQGDSWGDLWGFDYGSDPGHKTRPLANAVLDMDVTAVVCANDLLALAVWKMAATRGLRVPQDLSIIGMDNIVEAERRGMTSIAAAFQDIGAAAVDAVLHLIDGGDSREASRVLPVTLIERQSIGPRR